MKTNEKQLYGGAHEEAHGYVVATEKPLTEEVLTEEPLAEESFMEEPVVEEPMAKEFLTATPESDFTWDGTTITGYTGVGSYDSEGVDIVIPAKAEKIGDYAFQNVPGIKSVAFEDGSRLETIGKGANMKTLVYGADYTVVYSDNVQKGKASVRITGVASKGYVGSKTAKFTIGTKNVSALRELLKKLFGGN